MHACMVPGMMKAAKLLERWRRAHGLSQSAAGARVGVSQVAWCRLEAGKMTPGVSLAFTLERVTGTPAKAWAVRGAA